MLLSHGLYLLFASVTVHARALNSRGYWDPDPSITADAVTYPKAGSLLHAGSNYALDWETVENDDLGDGGVNFDIKLVRGAAHVDTGLYFYTYYDERGYGFKYSLPWKVPYNNSLPDADDYMFEFLYDGTKLYSSAFTIWGSQSKTETAPNFSTSATATAVASTSASGSVVSTTSSATTGATTSATTSATAVPSASPSTSHKTAYVVSAAAGSVCLIGLLCLFLLRRFGSGRTPKASTRLNDEDETSKGDFIPQTVVEGRVEIDGLHSPYTGGEVHGDSKGYMDAHQRPYTGSEMDGETKGYGGRAEVDGTAWQKPAPYNQHPTSQPYGRKEAFEMDAVKRQSTMRVELQGSDRF